MRMTTFVFALLCRQVLGISLYHDDNDQNFHFSSHKVFKDSLSRILLDYQNDTRTELTEEEFDIIKKMWNDAKNITNYPSSLIQLNSLHDQMATLEYSLRNVSAMCTGRHLFCDSVELDELIDTFSDHRSTVEAKLHPITTQINKVESAKDKIVSINKLRGVVDTALSIAGQIPKIGTILFKGPAKVIGALKIPMNGLADTTSATTSSLVTPWSNSVGRISEYTEILETKIQAVITELMSTPTTGFASMLEGQCVEESLDVLAFHKFTPIVDKVRTSIKGLVTALRKMNAKFASIRKILNSKSWKTTWNKMKTGFNKVTNAINTIAKPLEGLKPLTELLKKKITISWPNSIHWKDDYGLPGQCPSGYQKKGLLCGKCTKGYTYDGIATCWKSSCPKGYDKATDLACKNKYYHVRKTKGCKLKIRWPPTKSSCSCGDWDRASYGVGCWKKCPKDYKKDNIKVLAFCYKNCPSGYTLDPTKALCIRNSKKAKVTEKICKRGKKNFVGRCIETCSGDSEDLGLICVKFKDFSFSVQDIFDEFKKVKKKIEGLPLIKQIESSIQKLVKVVMEPILDFLDLPTPEELKEKLDVSKMALLKPIQQLAGLLESGVDKISSVTDSLELNSDLIEKQKDAIVDAMGLPTFTDFSNECITNMSCLSSKLGVDIPFTSLDAIKAAFEDAAKVFELEEFGSAIQNLTSIDVDADFSCDEEGTFKIPIEETLRKALGKVPGPHPCSIDINICTKPNVNISSLQPKLNYLRKIMSPAIDAISSLIPDVSPSFLQTESTIKSDESKSIDKDNFALPFFIFPLSVPYYIHTDGIAFKGTTYWKNIGGKVKTKNIAVMGTTVSIGPGMTFLVLYAGKSGGKDYVSMDIRFKFHIFDLKVAKGHPKTVINEAMEQFEKFLHSLQNDYSFGVTKCWNGLSKTLGSTACADLKYRVDQLLDPFSWTWDNQLKGWQDRLEKPETDGYWKSLKGKTEVRRVFDFITKETRERKKQARLVSKKLNKSMKKFSLLNIKISNTGAIKQQLIAQFWRTMHSPPLRWIPIIPKHTAKWHPSIGTQLTYWPWAGFGFEVWKSLIDLDAIERLKVYFPLFIWQGLRDKTKMLEKWKKYENRQGKDISFELIVLFGLRCTLGVSGPPPAYDLGVP